MDAGRCRGRCARHRSRGGSRRTWDRLRRQLELELQLELVKQLQLELVKQLELEFVEQLELELVKQLQLQFVKQLELELRKRLVVQVRPLIAGDLITMKLRTRPAIEFLCRPEDQGVIAEPVRAMKVLPAWFKQLPGIDKAQVSATNDGLTVKRCMPFLDAMSTGWILPLAATVRLEISDGGATVTGGWKFDREMVSNHGPGQVAGNPFEPRPPMKFHNYWSIRTAKGWSCLFLPPLNRPNPVVEVFSGVVDTDTYSAPINFPFVATAADGVYTLEKGTPLVQVVPFRRVDAAISASVRAETPAECEERIRIARSTDAGAGWYRHHARASRA